MKIEGKSFVTIFLPAQNVHCYKDVGMIPRTMAKNFGYKSYLVCKGEGEYDHFEDLTLIKLGNNKILAELKLINLIVFNAKKISILNLYHWGRHTYFIGLLYKFFNKKGKLYVKCDLDSRGLSVIQENSRAKDIYKRIAEISDLISCESTWIADSLNGLLKSKVQYVPNGISDITINIESHETLRKEKFILTVGRLGTEQKATENLVEAFKMLAGKIPDWKLLLVGGMTQEFEIYLTNTKTNNRNLETRIITTGEIKDKCELNKIYSKSAIFALPSRWEGFALVMLESLNRGCYFIGTKGIAPIKDVIISEEIGKIVSIDNIEELSNEILDSINNKEYLDDEFAEKRMRYVAKNYSWSAICKKILLYLNGV